MNDVNGFLFVGICENRFFNDHVSLDDMPPLESFGYAPT